MCRLQEELEHYRRGGGVEGKRGVEGEKEAFKARRRCRRRGGGREREMEALKKRRR